MTLSKNTKESKENRETFLKINEQTDFDRKHLESILETIPSAVVVVDASGKFSYLNKRALDLYGINYLNYNLGDHIAKVKALRPDGSLFPLEDMPISYSLKLGQQVRNVEMIIQKSNGTQVPVLVSSAPLYDTKKNIIAAIAIFEDITERKKVEEALRKSEEQKNNLLESITDGFVAFDRGWRYTYVNSNAAKILHKSKEELLGRVGWDAFPEATKLKFFTEFNRAVNTGVPVHFEEYYPKPLNIWYECHCYPSDEGLTVIFSDITKRKRIEETLKTSVEKYRTLFNSIDEGYFIIDVIFNEENQPIDLFYIEANPAATKIVGEDWTGKRLSEISSNYEKYWFEIFGNVALTGKSIRLERYAEPDKKWYSFYVFKIGDKNSRRIGNTFIDITERKKSEEALKESESLYRTLFDNSKDGFQLDEVLFDNAANPYDWVFLNINPAFEYQTGLKRTDVIGKRAKEILPNIEDYWILALGRVVKSGKSEHMENYNQDTNRWYDDYIFKYKEGQVGILFRDITERKNLEEQVKKSEHDYRELFNSMNEMFQVLELIYDDKGHAVDFIYREVNPASWKLENLSREQMINKRAKELFGVVEDYWLEALNQVNMTGKPTQLENYSGAIDRYYDVYIWKVTDSQNKVAIIFSDITARKKLEKELSNKERLATIGATAGMVGHDIRNPLQAIIGDIYLAKQDVATLVESDAKENLKENLGAMEENVTYINKIVLDLQDYARPLKPVAKEIDIKPLIEEAFQSKRIPKNVETYYHIDDDANILCTDPDLLKRILNNLGSNAIQAMPNGGKVFVNVAKNDEDLLISIEDTGVGIPEELKPKLFQPMMTTKSKGQGFGLAVVKRLTEALGGTVSFESEAGKGTKFILCLPSIKKIDRS